MRSCSTELMSSADSVTAPALFESFCLLLRVFSKSVSSANVVRLPIPVTSVLSICENELFAIHPIPCLRQSLTNTKAV